MDNKFFIKLGRGCGKSTLAFAQCKWLMMMMILEMIPFYKRSKLRQIALGKLEEE